MSTDRQRSALIAHASQMLAEALDYERTLVAVAQLATPELGAWSIVDLCDGPESFRRVAILHPDPAKQALARALADDWPPGLDDPLGAPAVVRTRRSVVLPYVSDDLLRAVARSADHLRVLRELKMGSLMTVPMIARGRVLGAMTFVSGQVGHTYTDGDVALAAELASRAALALDNARLYTAAVDRADAEASHARSEATRAAAESARADAASARADAEVQRSDREIRRMTAEAATRAKAEFLTTMSHELRTPLNVIAGYADLLDLGVRGELTAAQREDVQRIRRSQRQLLALVNDVLNFARLEAAAVRFDMADVPVQPLVADTLALVTPQMAAKRFTVEQRCGLSVAARTDPEKAQHVILNLLSNAIKFTPPGGTIALECEADHRAVRVRVRDTGPGIPANKVETIFDPFVRIDQSLTRTTEGTGLGLAISRQLARALGGDVAVEETTPRGSSFTLTLPRAGEAAPRAS